MIKNLRLNKIRNVVAYNIAVGKLKDKVKFFISKHNVGAHSLINNKNDECIGVKSVSLKKIFQENNLKKVNLLKIDCEGCEYEILLKSPRSILKKIDTIVLEQHITSYTKKYKEESITDHLKSIGFSIEILKQIYYKKEGRFFIILAKRINKNDLNST